MYYNETAVDKPDKVGFVRKGSLYLVAVAEGTPSIPCGRIALHCTALVETFRASATRRSLNRDDISTYSS